MKIAFFSSYLLPIHAKTLDEKPLGGTETGVIRLAAALDQLGHDVTVFTTHEAPPPSKPRYLPLKDLKTSGEFDVFIGMRDWIPLVQEIKAKRKMLWVTDSYDVFHTFGIGDKRVAKRIDTLLTVSRWQAQTLAAYSDFPLQKAFVIGNGIEIDLFKGSEVRHPKRLIYSSTPHRGLIHIPLLFTELKKRHNDLEIHIFSGYQVYGAPSSMGAYEQLKIQLEAMPDVHFRGNITQKELAREFMKSSILFYPCNYEETFCITALEAQAAGCVVVTSKHSALPETVGDAGLLIPGKPGSPEYNSAFIDATDELLKKPELLKQLSERGIARAKTRSWMDVAKHFDQYLKSQETQIQ